VYVTRSDGIYAHSDGSGDPLQAALGPTRILKLPIREGESFVAMDRALNAPIDVDNDGRPDQLRVRTVSTVIGFEAVSTPAGHFSQALRIRSLMTQTLTISSTGERFSGHGETNTWFVRDVGLVRQTEVARFNGTVILETSRQLVAYSVGPLKSETDPPTVVAYTPEPGIHTQPPSLGVTVTFSEPMDPDSIDDTLFVVHDQTGAAITGTVQPMLGNQYAFAPHRPWVSGNLYTVTVSASARDRIGNAMEAPVTWAFEFDFLAPSVAATQPANGAREVSRSADVIFQFDQAIDPGSVDSTTVTASSGGVAHAVTTAVSGSVLTITPAVPWPSFGEVRVSVSGVTDLVGNRMYSAHELTFTPDQGLFAFQEPIWPGSAADIQATAVGDLNGDGIGDIVLAVGPFAFGAAHSELFLNQGRLGASPAAPVRIGPEIPCRVQSIHIADVQGTGTRDLVIGTETCGIRILLQHSGTYVAGGTADLPVVSAHSFALGADGRPEVWVAANGSLRVWRIGTDGTLTGGSTTLLNTSRPVRAIATGDVNADGRTDAVLAYDSIAVEGEHLLVLYQLPGGGFDGGRYLSTESPWGASGVAIGDVNGDGRNDIVASTGGNAPSRIAVFHQAGNGTYGSVHIHEGYHIPYFVKLADVNNDGRVDVVVGYPVYSAVGVSLQRSDGSLEAESLFAALSGGVHPMLAIGDTNGDGLPDIVNSASWLRQKTPLSSVASAASLGPASMSASMLRAFRRARPSH
jgi:hypothetical protein